jgi:hypothetical protein
VGAITDVRITRWIPFATKPSAQVVVGCVISIALSIESVYLLGMMTGEPSMAVVLFAIISMLLSYIVPTAVVVLALYRAFQRHLARKTQIRVVVSSYFCMIVVFTGVFFSMQFLGDHEYAIDHYGYYRSGGESLQQGRIKKTQSVSRKSYLFIDSVHLKPNFARVTEAWSGVAGEIDIAKVRNASSAPKVFYYDSVDDALRSGETQDELARSVEQQERDFRRINAFSDTHVRLGSITGSGKKRRHQSRHHGPQLP